MRDLKEIEKSIIKKYRKEIWRPFVRALQDFSLVEEGDHVAVAISGGKDSLLLAKAMQELQRHSEIKFELSFLSMNPGFSELNLENMKKNCEELGIPVQIYDSNIFDVLEEKAKDQPCYLCARMRRGFLYDRAKQLGANKLALGHHLDDVVETIMLNVLYAGNYMTMMPILDSTNFEGLKLIRPLYYIEESTILDWKKYCGIHAMDCGCAVARKEIMGKRLEMKNMIAQMQTYNPNVKKSILKSSQNIYINAVLGYIDGEEKILNVSGVESKSDKKLIK